MQLDLPTLHVSPRRPLAPIGAAMMLLDLDEDQVLSLIEEGGLAWAWDIRGPGASRREVRIWLGALTAHLTGAPQPVIEEGELLPRLLPHARPSLRSPELQRLFTCSATHIQGLISAGEISGERAARKGPSGWVPVTRESVLGFLGRRRVL